jgi:tRNA nucleotidyltransferase (CCA-adding enzyme)
VTLEEDLARRDLTINAMALDETGGLVDPFGGRADLEAKVLRHVGPAFAEDPVRILRLARFAARFSAFSVAAETMQLARAMIDAGEVDALVPERVWQEIARGLMQARPSRMFETLRECGALARLLPEIDRLWGVPQPAEYHPEIDTGVHLMRVLDAAACIGAQLPARWAAALHDLGKGSTPQEEWPRHIGHEARSVELARTVNERLRVPNDCRDASLLAAREHGHIHRALELDAAALLRLLERCDALRRPELLAQVLDASEADARGRAGREDDPYPQRGRILDALDAARGVDAGAIAARVGPNGERIAQAVHQARAAAIDAALR